MDNQKELLLAKVGDAYNSLTEVYFLIQGSDNEELKTSYELLGAGLLKVHSDSIEDPEEKKKWKVVE